MQPALRAARATAPPPPGLPVLTKWGWTGSQVKTVSVRPSRDTGTLSNQVDCREQHDDRDDRDHQEGRPQGGVSRWVVAVLSLL